MDYENEVDWSVHSKVVSSDYRTSVLLALTSNPYTPSELAEHFDIQISHISRTLKELSDLNLVECLTPKEKVGRLYRATEKGEKHAKIIEKKREED